MTAALPDATAELQHWRDHGLTLPVWWRDDDAVAPTPALDRLIGLAGQFGAPIHLAVVPEPATPALADRLQAVVGAFVLTHGWRHANHAPADQKKAEFGPHRAAAAMLEEIISGRQRLLDLFGDRALPIFTPPWNRISLEIVGQLRAAGFIALSSFTPREAKFAAEGLLQVNTHLDPIAWKSGGGLVEPSLLDRQIAQDLENRRTGHADNGEPYGILTHHLVQDDDTWAFTETLLGVLAASDVAQWTPPLRELH